MQQTTDPRPLHVLYGLLLPIVHNVNTILYYVDTAWAIGLISMCDRLDLLENLSKQEQKEPNKDFIRKMIEITKPKTE